METKFFIETKWYETWFDVVWRIEDDNDTEVIMKPYDTLEQAEKELGLLVKEHMFNPNDLTSDCVMEAIIIKCNVDISKPLNENYILENFEDVTDFILATPNDFSFYDKNYNPYEEYYQ